MKKFLTLTFVILFAFALVACTGNGGNEGGNEGGNGGGGNSGNTTVPQSISITASSKTVKIGKTVQLTAKVKPDGASQEVTWSSNKPEFATVDNNGTVTGVGKGKAVITATSVAAPDISAKVTISVNDSTVGDIDMGGYEIRIAFSPGVEYELDPRMDTSNHPEYKISPTRKYAAEAWNEMEEKYNCHIVVAGYPIEDYYGRFDWIVDQGKIGEAEFDIYWIPTNQISKCYTALMTLDDLVSLHGANTMSDADTLARTYKQELYGWSYTSGSITSDDPVIGMNYNLFNLIEMGADKEPAKLFMEDKWSIDDFVEWCLEAQTKLNALSTGEEDKYYVISGRLSYWLRDMTRTSGVPLADLVKMDMNLTHPTMVQIADTLHELYKAGCVDPANQVDGHVESWNNQHALLNTGSAYFVDYYNRWKADLWGEGDATLYAFVPWPYANDATHATARWANYTQDCFSMPKAVTKKIEGAMEKSDDVTPENIFKIWVECFTRAEEIKNADPLYDKEGTDRQVAGAKWDTTASVDAWVYIQDHLDTNGIFDPIKELRLNNGDGEDWEKQSAGYILEISSYTTATSYVEAVTPSLKQLQQTFVEKYN